LNVDNGAGEQRLRCENILRCTIVGHRASNALVKYLSEGREMEIALAPIAGTRLLAPFRLSIVSMLANLVIEANRFEAGARPLDASTVADPKAQ
jgi:hypothetical protein